MLRYHRDSASSRIMSVVLLLSIRFGIWCSFLETGGIVRHYRSDEFNHRIHMTFAEILPRSIFFKFAFGRYKLNVMIYMILTTNQETFSLMILAKRNRQQEQQRAANALNSIALWKHLTKQSFLSTFIYL